MTTVISIKAFITNAARVVGGNIGQGVAFIVANSMVAAIVGAYLCLAVLARVLHITVAVVITVGVCSAGSVALARFIAKVDATI